MNRADDVSEDRPTRNGPSSRAKLRIFLGMAAGVGKTYAMLKEGRAALERGLDLVVAWAEPHGRPETDALLEGLELLPPRLDSYKGLELREMDLDAVLGRRPSVALVDELAHSNTPGLRHAKRYEDVLELLEAGIEVWTTVNIQHLESMADSVELLTLAPVRERVPDSVFDRADEVQLIDLPPDELLRRLAEGRVYTGEASREAVENFFTKTKLSALREIALRQASLLASHETRESARQGATAEPSANLVLVAVGPSPHGQDLLRWSRRLAYGLKADLECVHVDEGRAMGEAERSILAANLRLARDLGATVSTLVGADVASLVAERARQRRAFALVVGKSGLAPGLRLFAKPGLTERIIRDSREIPVFAVQERPLRAVRGTAPSGRRETLLRSHLAAALAVALSTLLNLGLAPLAGYWSASVLYLSTICLLALRLDRASVFGAALVSALLWDFLFIPPRFTFTVSRPEDGLMLGLYLLIAMTTGLLTNRLKAGARLLATREARLRAIGQLASELAGTAGLEGLLAASTRALEGTFEARAIFLLADTGGGLEARARPKDLSLDERERAAAAWAFERGEAAGRFTRTLPLAAWHFVPLEAQAGRLGVLGLRLGEGRVWDEEDEAWLATMARTISTALERERLAERAAAADLSRESERLGSLILDSVSHELRSPLAVIEGAASALEEEDSGLDGEARTELLREIGRGARRLDLVVEELLSMSRLESGQLSLHLSDCDPLDLAETSLERAREELRGGKASLRGPAEPSTLRCDEGLIVQLLLNLLRNCGRHAGPSPRVELLVEQDAGETRFVLRDDGPGVPAAALPKIFEKFYRASPGRRGGTGLGLAVCRGIALAHGGRIVARNLPRGGFEVELSLPDKGPRAEEKPR